MSNNIFEKYILEQELFDALQSDPVDIVTVVAHCIQQYRVDERVFGATSALVLHPDAKTLANQMLWDIGPEVLTDEFLDEISTGLDTWLKMYNLQKEIIPAEILKELVGEKINKIWDPVVFMTTGYEVMCRHPFFSGEWIAGHSLFESSYNLVLESTNEEFVANVFNRIREMYSNRGLYSRVAGH